MLVSYIVVGIEEDKSFHVVRRLLGPGGRNMQFIISESGSGTLVALRGRGYHRSMDCEETADALAFHVRATTQRSLDCAVKLLTDLLADVHDEYREFCEANSKFSVQCMVDRLTCAIRVGIEEDAAFRVVRRLLGIGGKNMQFIISEAGQGTMVAILGRGSQLGGNHWQASQGPLVARVSAANRPSFDRACELVRDLLADVNEEYKQFCRMRQ